MALTAQDYAAMLRGLIPVGPAWNGELVDRLISTWSIELARLDARIAAAVNEADPRTAVELLEDWERVLGLPDECTADLGLSIPDRQRLAWAKLTEEGGQSIPYFVALADRYGEPDLQVVDGFGPMTCNDDCNDALYTEADRFVWQANFGRPAEDSRAMTCNDDCNSPLQFYTASLAECPLNERKPAHTTVVFTYLTDDLFDLPNWREWMPYLDLAIDAMPSA